MTIQWRTLLHCGNEKESILIKKSESIMSNPKYIVGYSDELQIVEKLNEAQLLTDTNCFSTMEETCQHFLQLPFTSMYPIEVDSSICDFLIEIITHIEDKDNKSLWFYFFSRVS